MSKKITVSLVFILFLSCTAVYAKNKTVKIAYVNWSSSVATSYTMKAVLEEKLDINCRLVQMPADEMWSSVAKGKVDAILSAWLPDTHESYYAEYKDDVLNLGANLDGTKIGLVIPQIASGRITSGTGIKNKPYMQVGSIPDLKNHRKDLNSRIVGIDPEAGIMIKTRQAIDEYNLDRFRLVDINESNMVKELERAVSYKKWIVITGWEPHWIFARWDLKFLDDPKNVYGDGGHISTIARKGLKEDMPEVFNLLDNFYWEKSDIEQIMLWIHADGGNFPYEKAMRWIRSNEKTVDGWIN